MIPDMDVFADSLKKQSAHYSAIDDIDANDANYATERKEKFEAEHLQWRLPSSSLHIYENPEVTAETASQLVYRRFCDEAFSIALKKGPSPVNRPATSVDRLETDTDELQPAAKLSSTLSTYQKLGDACVA
ncbi:hypothetical protein N0V90_012318 [Kalmusia sp. IMI 367209]|nr:hypothetical protein N0V90_012318 [Kalmusia sp. IMI 367209]